MYWMRSLADGGQLHFLELVLDVLPSLQPLSLHQVPGFLPELPLEAEIVLLLLPELQLEFG